MAETLRRAVPPAGVDEETERRASAGHLYLFKSIAGELTLSLACSETCHRPVEGKSCVERGVQDLCPSCLALHHANEFEMAVRRLLEERRRAG